MHPKTPGAPRSPLLAPRDSSLCPKAPCLHPEIPAFTPKVLSSRPAAPCWHSEVPCLHPTVPTLVPRGPHLPPTRAGKRRGGRGRTTHPPPPPLPPHPGPPAPSPPRERLWGQQSPWGPWQRARGGAANGVRPGRTRSCSLQSHSHPKSPPSSTARTGDAGASSAPPCLSFPTAGGEGMSHPRVLAVTMPRRRGAEPAQ